MAQPPQAKTYRPVTGQRFDALLVIISRYHEEGKRCAKAKAYYAACAMVGAALEGSLLAMCSLYPDEVSKFVTATPNLQRLQIHMNRWMLGDLITIATGLGWLPARTHKNARLKIGDLVEFNQELRNLLHAGRHVRDYPKVKIAKRHYEDTAAIFEAANSWLLDRIYSAMRAKDKRQTKRSRNP